MSNDSDRPSSKKSQAPGPEAPKPAQSQSPSKKDRENGHLMSAADVLQALLQNSKSQLSDGFLRWKLEQQWPQVVGKTIAENTLPAAYHRGSRTLHIWVRHSAWMQQLWYFQDAIKEKVNTHLGKPWVEQVRFTLSRRAATTELGGSED